MSERRLCTPRLKDSRRSGNRTLAPCSPRHSLRKCAVPYNGGALAIALLPLQATLVQAELSTRAGGVSTQFPGHIRWDGNGDQPPKTDLQIAVNEMVPNGDFCLFHGGSVPRTFVSTGVDPRCAFTATALKYTLGLSAGTLGCFPNTLQTHHLLVVPVQASGNQASLRTKLVTRLSLCADTGVVSNGDRTDGADVDSTYGRVANKKSSMFKASLVGSPKANVISCSKQTFAFEATVCFRTHLSRHQPHRCVRRIPCNPLVL